MLQAVAKNGGVVQVNFFNGSDDENFRKAIDAQAKDQAAAIQKFMDERKTQGNPVDYWTDQRFTSGGLGFFEERKQQAAIQSVQFTLFNKGAQIVEIPWK